MHDIPAMLVGPFTGWQSRLPKPNVHSFADLVAIPEQRTFFSDHEVIRHDEAVSVIDDVHWIDANSGAIVCLKAIIERQLLHCSAQMGQRCDFVGRVQCVGYAQC